LHHTSLLSLNLQQPTMILDLHHATDDKGAYGIDRDQEFHFGSHGFAGPGIYFATDKKYAIARAFNGQPKKVTVVISCRVNLGKCLKAQPNPVGQEIMNQAKCVAKGCDSVNITGSGTLGTTYAVYDPARVTILGFKSNKFEIGLQPTMKMLRASETFVAAIKASPERCLKEGDLGHLYTQHPGLAEDMGSKLKPVCDTHSELHWSVYGVRLSKHSSSPSGSSSSTQSSTTSSDAESEPLQPKLALNLLVEAIRASPFGSLDAVADMASLYSKHPSLRDILRESGGVKAFCEAHTELSWLNGKVKESTKFKIQQAKELQQKQALAQQMQKKQDEEALQQRQVLAQQMQKKKDEDEARRQYRQVVQLQIKLDEERQCRQEKASRQQKQALAQQQRIQQQQQQQKKDEARRQQILAPLSRAMLEAREEQEYYEAR